MYTQASGRTYDAEIWLICCLTLIPAGTWVGLSQPGAAEPHWRSRRRLAGLVGRSGRAALPPFVYRVRENALHGTLKRFYRGWAASLQLTEREVRESVGGLSSLKINVCMQIADLHCAVLVSLRLIWLENKTPGQTSTRQLHHKLQFVLKCGFKFEHLGLAPPEPCHQKGVSSSDALLKSCVAHLFILLKSHRITHAIIWLDLEANIAG